MTQSRGATHNNSNTDASLSWMLTYNMLHLHGKFTMHLLIGKIKTKFPFQVIALTLNNNLESTGMQSK